jgi:HlyD family secretion protein
MNPHPETAKRRWPLFVGIGVVLLAIALLVYWWRGTAVSVEAVVRRDVVQTVVASGRIETPHRVDIAAQITGSVVRVPVAEGESVKQGALLIELDNRELLAQQRQAEVAVQQAELKLRQLREVQAPVSEQNLRQASITLENAKTSLQRNQSLFQKGFIGQAGLDESRKAVQLAEAQVAALQKQAASNAPSGSDYALLEAAVASAKASRDASVARSRYAQIFAPQAGNLIARNVEVGDVVQPGKALMTLSPQGRTQLIVQIDEKNLRLLNLGQTALASSDAYPQQRFDAVVSYINPAVHAQTGAVEVKLDVANAPAFVKQDMTVSVDIAVARRPQALLLSAGSVYAAESNAPWALRLQDGTLHKVPLKIGLKTGGVVEILEGLREGEQVIPVSAKLSEGARVHLVPAPERKAPTGKAN